MARTLVGLDIGSSGVRAAEFAVQRRRVTLRRFAAVPLPPGVVRAGTVVDGEALTEALKEVRSLGKFSTRNVTLGIANAGVMVRQMDLDWMPPRDFAKALRYQVEDALPFPVEEANLDYHLLEELDVATAGGEPRRVARVLLIAATREMVDAFVSAAQRAGLRPTGVDLLPFALVRARTPGGLDPAGEVEAIVDIGADVVSVVVHAGGVPRYVRMIPGIGGDAVTEAVQQRYDWTWDDAERTKLFVGLPGHARMDAGQQEAVGTRGDGLDHPAQKVIGAAVETLVQEIVTTLDFYRSSTADADGGPVAEPAGGGYQGLDDPMGPDGHDEVDGYPDVADAPRSPAIARLLLAGSAARLGGLRELLEDRLDLSVEMLDAHTDIRAPRKVRATGTLPSLAVSAGLCVGASR
jgi:type IV pilus assembly protein PilM